MTQDLFRKAKYLTLDSLSRWTLIAIIPLLIVVAATQLNPFPTLRGDSVGAAVDYGGDVLKQAIYISLFALTVICGGALHWPRKLLSLTLGMTMLLGWCWLSLFWAVDPGASFRRLVLTSILIWTLFTLVEALGYDLVERVMAWTLLILLVCNFLAVATVPGAVHQFHSGGDDNVGWRGILPHKNGTGPLCAVTIFYFMFGARRFSSWARAAIIVAAAFFLYMTVAKTAMGMTLLALLLGALYTRYDSRLQHLLVPVAVIFMAGLTLLVSIYWEPVLANLSSSQDAFTDRILIWRALVYYSLDHPLLGTGFGSMWGVGDKSPIFEYGPGWLAHNAPNGHNGYLDLLAQLGFPGLLMVLAACYFGPILRLLGSSAIPRRAGAIQLAILVYCLGANFTESLMMERDQLMQVVMVIAIASIANLARHGSADPAPSRVDRLPRWQRRAQRVGLR